MAVNSPALVAPFSRSLNTQRTMQPVETTRRQRLALLIQESGTQSALSEKIEKSPAQISQWLNASLNSKTGKPRVMSHGIAREIEEKLGKPSGWMDQPTEGGQGAGRPADAEESNVSEGPAIRGPYPLISEVQAGMWTELCDNFAPGDAEDWLPSTKNLGECGYMLRVNGNSMENPGGRFSFPEGMVLHVNPDLDPAPNQFVIVRRESTKQATFKRYVVIDGEPYLEAINPDWPKDKKYLPLQPGDAWCGVVVDASYGGLL